MVFEIILFQQKLSLDYFMFAFLFSLWEFLQCALIFQALTKKDLEMINKAIRILKAYFVVLICAIIYFLVERGNSELFRIQKDGFFTVGSLFWSLMGSFCLHFLITFPGVMRLKSILMSEK